MNDIRFQVINARGGLLFSLWNCNVYHQTNYCLILLSGVTFLEVIIFK